MALPAVVVLLALTSLSAASAPDCKDLVKPFMPEDPKLVGFLCLFLIYPQRCLDILNITMILGCLCEGFWKMGVCDGSW